MQISHDAFGQIVERYQRVVYAVSYASTRDRALADDLTQETFVLAWRRLADLRDATRMPAWLCGIARNLARDALKRRRREHVADVDELVDPATPFDALSDAESERLVAGALAGVPLVYREPLVLFYFEQHSVEDVAGVLGISAATTNKRLSRGRQHLAARVAELVERKVAARGPKRDLAACVLAAIAVPLPHVDPSLVHAKGSIMLKLAVPVALVATVTGVGLLSADAPKRSRATPVVHQARPPAPRLPVKSIPTCAAVGDHLAQITLDAFGSAKSLPAKKRDAFLAQRSQDLTARCTTEAWSEDRRLCAIGVTDADDEVTCREQAFATPEELAKLPAELQCDAVARHLTALAMAPGAKFDVFAKKMAAAGKPVDLTELTLKLEVDTRTKCEDLSWTVATRQCIVKSRTHADTATCW